MFTVTVPSLVRITSNCQVVALICSKLMGVGDPAFAVPVTFTSERVKSVTGSVNVINVTTVHILPSICTVIGSGSANVMGPDGMPLFLIIEVVMVGVGGVVSTTSVTGSEAVFGFPA